MMPDWLAQKFLMRMRKEIILDLMGVTRWERRSEETLLSTAMVFQEATDLKFISVITSSSLTPPEKDLANAIAKACHVEISHHAIVGHQEALAYLQQKKVTDTGEGLAVMPWIILYGHEALSPTLAPFTSTQRLIKTYTLNALLTYPQYKKGLWQTLQQGMKDHVT